MDNLLCQLQRLVNEGREALNLRALEQKSVQAGLAAYRAILRENPSAFSALSAAQQQAILAGNNYQPSSGGAGGVFAGLGSDPPQDAALVVPGRSSGRQPRRAVRKRHGRRRLGGSQVEPIYVHHGGSVENGSVQIYRGDQVVHSFEVFDNPAFPGANSGYRSGLEEAYAVWASDAFLPGESVTFTYAAIDQQFSSRLCSALLLDSVVYVVYTRGYRLFEAVDAAPQFTQGSGSVPSWNYYDVALTAFDLNTGQAVSAAAPFFERQLVITAFSQNAIQKFYAYTQTVQQSTVAEALSSILPESHPLAACGAGFWEPDPMAPPYDFLPGAALGQPHDLNTFKALLVPSSFTGSDRFLAFPEINFPVSANLADAQRVLVRSSVAALGDLAPNLLTCAGYRLAFGPYSGSFAAYSPDEVEDIEDFFDLDRFSAEAQQVITGDLSVPLESVGTFAVPGTPNGPLEEIYAKAVPADQDFQVLDLPPFSAIDTLFLIAG